MGKLLLGKKLLLPVFVLPEKQKKRKSETCRRHWQRRKSSCGDSRVNQRATEKQKMIQVGRSRRQEAAVRKGSGVKMMTRKKKLRQGSAEITMLVSAIKNKGSFVVMLPL